MKKSSIITSIVITFFFSISCNSTSNKEIANEGNSDEITTASGLTYSMIQNGSGPKVENGKEVTTHCILTLEDGTLIWSSRDDGREYTFVQGVTSHLTGFEEVLSYMKEGDRLKVAIPGNLGYGPNGRDPIPPNATLIYDIEVLKVADRSDL
jgi:FKBP-type peptidyl-prolyl cis-trans isomerase